VQFRTDPVVFTRAKARATGIKLADLRGQAFTRLFHDTYVPLLELTTVWLQAATVVKRLPAAHHVSHHTVIRL